MEEAGITFMEYMELRCKKNKKGNYYWSISNKEKAILGIDTSKKGWVKANENRVITKEQVTKLLAMLKNRRFYSTSLKSVSLYERLLKISGCYWEADQDVTFLYLMHNSAGDSKIGISKHPYKRAANLTTASGYKVNLIAYWKVDSDPRQIESFLHKHFSSIRLLGEWFKGKITVEQVEAAIPCTYSYAM